MEFPSIDNAGAQQLPLRPTSIVYYIHTDDRVMASISVARPPPATDDDSIDLAIQLQLQDAELYESSSKGKGREDEESDELLAFRLQAEELENLPMFRADNQMARSMASAVYEDGPLLAEIHSQEQAAERDHGVARQMDDGVDPTDTGELGANVGPHVLDDELLEKLRVLYISGWEDPHEYQVGVEPRSSNEAQVESSAAGSNRVFDPSTINRRCEACREETKFFDVARLSCNHEYCRECLADLFEASMTDESLFPPRCCRQPIIMAKVRIFLKAELVQTFEKKRIEFETRDKTYCHSPSCSTFITLPNIESEVAVCPECYLRTCAICKKAEHPGDCPEDTALQEVLDAARENGWQRCYQCFRVVELGFGCHHMTFVKKTLGIDIDRLTFG
ncbi:hypothetical protein FQN54_006222 [Arachnomyces sp. PD_36]|nr:hypothetical protein FQN54_006222 [Arachnomyces sp. PD_36]